MKVRLAETFWSRLRGLMGRRSLGRGEGLLIRPCSGVHTFWMRFPLDVAYLNSTGEVLRIYHGVSPWRLLPVDRRTTQILETNAGELAGVRVGERVIMEIR